SPVEILSVNDDLVWKAAGLKARHPLSFADAFAGALALDRGATLVTGDNDFTHLQENEGLKVIMLERGARR
ncbi:MAG: PIN domain-containing protein, partial [Bradymonadaceae bacterium]